MILVKSRLKEKKNFRDIFEKNKAKILILCYNTTSPDSNSSNYLAYSTLEEFFPDLSSYRIRNFCNEIISANTKNIANASTTGVNMADSMV